ncbi:MAG: T9SS type A sorting domain-containing protein [Crocinitomicaceae bacterium]|nr:T9SS type A sorting domain-containing protein [Crocinitomicaceae bacterium]
MSKIINLFATSLLIIMGLGAISLIMLPPQTSVDTELRASYKKKTRILLHKSMQFVSSTVDFVDCPKPIRTKPTSTLVEIEKPQVEVIGITQKHETIEVGKTAFLLPSDCSWSCDGRCRNRITEVTFHEYPLPKKEVIFESIVFPNPAIDRLTLRLTVSIEITPILSLYSSTGEFIRKITYNGIHEGENDIPINILDLPNGIYFVVIYSDELKNTIRFIKQ